MGLLVKHLNGRDMRRSIFFFCIFYGQISLNFSFLFGKYQLIVGPVPAKSKKFCTTSLTFSIFERKILRFSIFSMSLPVATPLADFTHSREHAIVCMCLHLYSKSYTWKKIHNVLSTRISLIDFFFPPYPSQDTKIIYTINYCHPIVCSCVYV